PPPLPLGFTIAIPFFIDGLSISAGPVILLPIEISSSASASASPSNASTSSASASPSPSPSVSSSSLTEGAGEPDTPEREERPDGPVWSSGCRWIWAAREAGADVGRGL
ncbi:hypothetical protein BT69DRAFT_1290597, partial [Atractiella rhizophila]